MADRMNNFNGSEWLKHSFSIWRDVYKTKHERATKHPALFPEELAERLINIYTRKHGEVILDPFVGIGSTVKAAYKLGKKGIGFDLNADFIRKARKRVKTLDYKTEEKKPKKFYDPILKTLDSRKLDKELKPNSVDLVITSPPYWDILNQRRTADSKEIRNYSDNKKDLGNIDEYEKFLQELKLVMENVYTVLKPNKRCISVVMDLRKKDKYFPLHEDQSRIMREVGFELEEYVIWDRQRDYNNLRTLGYPYVFRFNKIHEYICIYWKR